MKIFVLTNELSAKSGWGRYSLDIKNGMETSGHELIVADTRLLPDPLNYYKNYLLSFWYAWKLKKYAKDCDIIHSFIEPYSFIAFLLAKITNKKYFVTAHGTYGVLPYYQSLLHRVFHSLSFKSASKIICVSSYTKKIMSEIGFKNLQIINNGINTKKFSGSLKKIANKRKNIVLTVGALKHRKGQHVSLEAFARASSGVDGLNYYIVGNHNDASYIKKIKGIIKKYNIENKVKFFSSISDEKLIELYSQAKIFVMTSLSEKKHFEGFGLVYLEANSCGTPTIGSFNSGAEDAIKHGVTGFLVEQNDMESIQKLMRKLIKDENLWQKMSENGILWARKHDWEIIIKEYVKLYRSSLK